MERGAGGSAGVAGVGESGVIRAGSNELGARSRGQGARHASGSESAPARRGESVQGRTGSKEQGAGRAELNRLDKMRRWLIVMPLAMPIYLLLVRGLIFDGWNGWYYAFQRTVAEMMLSLRLLEQKLRR